MREREMLQKSVDGNSIRRWIGSIGLALALAVAVSYFLAAQLGLALLTTPERVAVFWPASGIAAGILIAFGFRVWRPVAAGVIAASLPASLMGDRSLWGALAFGLCNAGEVVLLTWLIERWFGPAFNIDSLPRVLGFLVAAGVATATAAVGAAWAMGIFGPSTAPFFSVWHVWFASDLLGILTVAPLVIGLASVVREPPPRREFFEGVAALAAVAAITGIFVSLPPAPWKLPVALLFPLLLWLAARCRPVFASAGVFIFSLAIVWAITVGFGHFGDLDVPISDRILAAQAVILGVALCAIVLAALFAERRKHAAALMMLLAELDHRVKNVLARVAAVAMSTRQGSRSMDEFLRTLDGRIQSMAAAHSLMSQSRWHGVGITELVHHQLAPYTTAANTTISGPNVMLTAAATQAVAMVLHELVTNAAKYGALSTPSGRVSVNWDLQPSSGGGAASLTIAWREIGGPPVAAPVQSGYGTSLIRE